MFPLTLEGKNVSQVSPFKKKMGQAILAHAAQEFSILRPRFTLPHRREEIKKKCVCEPGRLIQHGRPGDISPMDYVTCSASTDASSDPSGVK